MALRRSRVRIPLGPLFILKHIEKVSPLQGASHGSNPSGSTKSILLDAFLLFWIEKVDPYQGAAHGFESLWVHKKRPFGCFFIILD